MRYSNSIWSLFKCHKAAGSVVLSLRWPERWMCTRVSTTGIAFDPGAVLTSVFSNGFPSIYRLRLECYRFNQSIEISILSLHLSPCNHERDSFSRILPSISYAPLEVFSRRFFLYFSHPPGWECSQLPCEGCWSLIIF